MDLSNITIHSLSEALAWTLLHSIWQVAAIAGILIIVFRVVNKNNAKLRYAMASLSMLLIFISAALTFVIALPEKIFVDAVNSAEQGNEILLYHSQSDLFLDWIKSLLPTPILFPILLRTWFVGIVLLSLRMVINYTNALRLKRHKVFQLNDNHMMIASNLLKRFNINKKVLFRESASIDSPSLIGYFKPVILLPIGLISGIPDNQLEVIIAHELAHIRRHDYLVQFVQGIIEILFFYHPMVWWLSSVVNTEREHICDDLAVKVCGESLTLIKALNNMESIRKKKPELVLSFSGKNKSLLNRVRRVLNPEVSKHPKLERGLLSALFVFVLSGMILFSNLANSTNQVKPKANNSVSLSIGDLGGDELHQSGSIVLAPQKKKKVKKNKIAQTPTKEVQSIEPQEVSTPMLPEVPELQELPDVLNDTIREVEEVLEIQEEALEEALKELEDVNVEISEETINELKESLRELESIDINIEKELIEAEADMEIELKELELINQETYIEIDEQADLSKKEKKELKAKIKSSIEKVNSEEFRQQLRENLERGRESLKRQLEKMKSGEFQKNIDIQKEKIKEMIVKFESPEFQKNLKGNLEKSREHIKERLKEIESPEFQKELKKKIDKAKKKKKRTVKIKGKTKNAPLYVLDGEIMSKKRSINDIDPQDIESINVLKGDAATDKYGKKAKQGVIEITTKRNKNSLSNQSLK